MDIIKVLLIIGCDTHFPVFFRWLVCPWKVEMQ